MQKDDGSEPQQPHAGAPARPLSLTPAERMMWGVRYEDGVLQLRTTGWRQVLGGFHIAVAGVLVPLTAFANHWNIVQIALGALWLCMSLLLYWQMWLGSVVATPDGLTVRWFVTRRFSWEQVDFFEVVEERPYWGDMGTWLAVDVVDVALRDGRRVKLWPLRSSNYGPGGDGDPSAASRKLQILTRYRNGLTS